MKVEKSRSPSCVEGFHGAEQNGETEQPNGPASSQKHAMNSHVPGQHRVLCQGRPVDADSVGFSGEVGAADKGAGRQARVVGNALPDQNREGPQGAASQGPAGGPVAGGTATGDPFQDLSGSRQVLFE